MHMNVKDSIWGLHELSGFWHYLAAFAVMSRDKRPLILSLLSVCVCLEKSRRMGLGDYLERRVGKEGGRGRSMHSAMQLHNCNSDQGARRQVGRLQQS